jgi:hypothetical protein
MGRTPRRGGKEEAGPSGQRRILLRHTAIITTQGDTFPMPSDDCKSLDLAFATSRNLPGSHQVASCMPAQIRRLLTKTFSQKHVSRPVMAGRHLRDNVTMPQNRENPAAPQIAFLDSSTQQVICAAIMYIHGPAFGYL